LEDIGKKSLRIAAKAVIFGIAYGRGAKAIALQCREEGAPISVEEAGSIINTVFEVYPDLVPFFERCRACVQPQNGRFMTGCFGRYRRFPRPFDDKTKGEFERQAMNFPMQNMVADAMNRAVDHLYHFREEPGNEHLGYQIALAVHDAVLLHVPCHDVPEVVDRVLPTCMVTRVPIYATDPHGFVVNDEAYHFGIDVEVSHHWGASMNPGEFLVRKISPRFGGYKKDDRGWYHPHHPERYWSKKGWINS
jgi:DNA polymerase I-like protein with 3'-5' exonuclease and polymerase domains